MSTHCPADFKNWLPVKLYRDGDALKLKWIYLRDVRFEKPFFDETVALLRTKNSTPPDTVSARETPLDALPEIAAALDAVPVSLLIFHTSRCGSTLVSQALSLNPAFITASEYLMFDQILRITELDPTISENYRDRLLKAVFKVVGQKRFPREESLIVKLDPWDFIFFERFSDMFPKSKKVVLFRDPDSIWNSIQKRPGMQFIPELVPPKYFGIDSPFEYFPDAYTDLVLRKMYRFIQRISKMNEDVLLLKYQSDMRENIRALFDFIHLAPGAIDRETLEARLACHSKSPNQKFVPDKKAASSPISRKTLDAYLEISGYSQGAPHMPLKS